MKLLFKFFALFGFASLVFFIIFISWIIFTNWSEINKPVPKWGFSGPELWEVVNNKRKVLGNQPLETDQQLCSLASIRLGHQLERNKHVPISQGNLDNHEGLESAMKQLNIPLDGKVGEFLTYAESPETAVTNWSNTLGHKILLTDPNLKSGCAYAQNGFGVVIASL